MCRGFYEEENALGGFFFFIITLFFKTMTQIIENFSAIFRIIGLFWCYLKFSRKTTVVWRLFCCEVTNAWFHNQDRNHDEGVEVEIDETLIVRYKYNRMSLSKQ